jgi:hypothetical protein
MVVVARVSPAVDATDIIVHDTCIGKIGDSASFDNARQEGAGILPTDSAERIFPD